MERRRSYYIFALMGYIKGFVWFLTASTVTKLLFKLMPIVISVLISYLVNAAILGDTQLIIKLGVGVVLCVLLAVLFSFFDVYVSHDMSYRILTKLRDKAYDTIDEVAPAATEGAQSGSFVSTIMHDIEFFEWFYAHILTEWLVVLSVSTAALIFMGLFSWILPAVILPFVVFIVFVPRIYAKNADKQGGAVRDNAAMLNSEVVTGVQGLKDIVSYGWQKHYFKRFISATNRANDAEVEYAKRSANEKRLITTAVELASVCASVCIAVLVMRGVVEAVWLMPLFMTAYAIFSPMQDALALSTNYGFVYGAAKRVFDLLQLKPVVLDNGKLKATEVVSEKSNCLVEFDTVCFTYPSSKTAENGRFVLSGASFSLKSGETVALVSSSGGGKTTVARLLQRFWDIDSGSIKINGVDVRELQLQELRDIVTVVPQDVYLFNESIYENLRLAKIDASKAEIIEACKSAQAEGYINALPKGFDTAVGERGLRLSGGEKQRLSIAQAFLKNSPVLVLDEASASLDTENEMLINQAVERLKAGRATMIIAHRLSTIKSADRIIFLCDGVVEGQGTFEELSSLNSRFKELVGSDFT